MDDVRLTDTGRVSSANDRKVHEYGHVVSRRGLLLRSAAFAAVLPLASLLAACGGGDDDDGDAGDTASAATPTNAVVAAIEPAASTATAPTATEPQAAEPTATLAATEAPTESVTMAASHTAASGSSTPDDTASGGVVTIDVLSTLAAIHLGVTPLGAPEVNGGIYSAFVDNFEGVTDIGGEMTIDVEQIVALAPDIVVGIDFGDGLVDNLQQTFDVTTVPFGPYHWREHHLAVGEALGLGDLAAEQIAAAEARIADIAVRVPEGAVLGVVQPYEGTTYIYTGWFPADILADAGFAFPGGLAFDPNEVDPGTSAGGIAAIPAEQIGDLADADVFLTPGRGDTIGAAVEAFTSLPLADTLPAVQAGHVYEVGFDAWGYQSVMSVLQICNDIEEFVFPALGA